MFAGIWGTLAVGIFGSMAGGQQIIYQLIGIISVGAFVTLFSVVILKLVDKFIGLRVSEHDELIGLDHSEHQEKSYSYSSDHIKKPTL